MKHPLKKSLVILLALLFIPVVAGADVVAYLTQSNALPDGNLYGQVNVTVVNSTTVQFTVDAFTTYLIPGTNFGIQSFGFNTNLLDPVTTGPPPHTLTSDFIFAGPSGWAMTYIQNMSEFGNFELDYAGNGNTRQDPLAFTLRYAPGGIPQSITPENFYIANTDGYHYASHIADFTNGFNGEDSAFFADGAFSVPEPGTLILLGSGLLGLVVVRGRKLRK